MVTDSPGRAGTARSTAVRGPFFDELSRGQSFSSPAVTLSSGLAAVHQSIVGDRLRLPLSAALSRSVTGAGSGPLAHPGLVCDVAIGQSTAATQNVRANLFYRGLVLHRQPAIGDELTTVTIVEALKENPVQPGRPATGLVVLRMRTADQTGARVLDFRRCAMLPLAPGAGPTGHHDDLGAADETSDDTFLAGIRHWLLPRATTEPVRAGDTFEIVGADVVSGAPELARLTLNLASVHHDSAAAGGRRLVYGGHTIGLALAQATRALPDLVTVLGWHSCDHLAPVHEGDRLTSTVEVERAEELEGGAQLLHLRSRVFATDDDTQPATSVQVLDWRFVAVRAGI